MSKNVVITRKIQLLFNTDNKDQVKEYYKTLFEWQNVVFRAANLISTHHFAQENIRDLHYFTDEVKVKLANISKDADGILTTSKQNTTYQLLSKKYKGEIPMAIITALNSQVVAVFNKEKSKYWKGEVSLRSYKRNMPIPIVATSLTNITKNEKC